MAKKSARQKTRPRSETANLGVTAERLQHGPVEQLERPIADDQGAVARPSGRVIDILAAMERRAAISSGMRDAGEALRHWFRVAHLDPLRAANLLRSPGASRYAGEGLPVEHARARVWRAIAAVGGPASPAGACLWHVVGLEHSLKEWALARGWSGRPIAQDAASGILIAALGALESHWRGAKG